MARQRDLCEDLPHLGRAEALPFLVSTWAGGVSGTLLMFAYDDISKPSENLDFELPWPDLSQFIGTLLVTSFIGALGCGVGLAICGLPISRLLRGYYRATWLPAVALLFGAGIGGCSLGLFARNWDAFMSGATYGGSTGLWYWYLYRRALIRGVAAAEAAAPET